MVRYKIAELAKARLSEHGLTEEGWTFEWDNGRRRLGLCSHRRKVVSLSRYLAPLASDEEVEDVILHEIAHALVGPGHGHDSEWKRKAIEIGCNGERCHNVNTAPLAKFLADCDCGKNHHSWMKKPNGGRRCLKCLKVLTIRRREEENP